MFVLRISFTEAQLREAVAASRCYSDALRAIGLRPAGGNHATVKKYVALWDIPTDHFAPKGPYPRGGTKRIPLDEILVEGSTYSRSNLKPRLYEAGLKQPFCEMCGQDERWNGRRMSLILDHINGVATDNRLGNLRILCPNCNATLETHCGRNKPRGRPPRGCEQCGGSFRASSGNQRFCSRTCASLHNAPLLRRAERPPSEKLLVMIDAEGYEAVGRRFGVSGNAIRKWLRAEGVEAPPGRGREFNPPPAPPRLLTDNDARRALTMLAAGRSRYSVAKQLGVSQKVIRALALGETYRDLDRPDDLPAAA